MISKNLNMFQRASQRLPLTPAERTILKGIKVFFIQALVLIMQNAASYLTSSKLIDLRQLLMESVIILVNTLAMSIHKYATANGDAAFQAAASVVDQEAKALSEKGQLVVPSIDYSKIEAIVLNAIAGIDHAKSAPSIAQYVVGFLRSEFAQQKASQQAATATVSQQQPNSSSQNQAAPAPSQASVAPMTVQPDVSKLQTTMMPAVQPGSWTTPTPAVAPQQDLSWMTAGPSAQQ